MDCKLYNHRVAIEAIESINGLKLIRPKVFADNRGSFSETYNVMEWSSEIGFTETFKQDNHSFSKKNVIRGLHSQPGMGKLVSVVSGKIFDVAVDIRPNSKTFGKWHGEILDATCATHFWIPDGFLHGFYTISEEGAHVVYKCSDVYNAKTEFGVNLFDAHINIKWPIVDRNEIIMSDRDKSNPSLFSLNLC